MHLSGTKDTACLICGGSIREYSSYGRWTVTKCRGCGFGQTNVTGSDLSGFYEDDYFQGNRARFCQPAEEKISDSRRWWLDRFVRGHDIQCLEIGPGPAAMVPGYLAETRRGFSYTAVEISRAASEQLRRRGYEVLTGRIYDEQISGRVANRFDYVVATEVIEHDTDPRGFARGVFSALKPGGCVCLTTGNFDGLTARLKGASWAYLDPPAHVFYFTPRAIRKLFADVGFRGVQIHCVGLNYIKLYQRFPIPGMLAAIHWLRIPTGMTISAHKPSSRSQGPECA